MKVEIDDLNQPMIKWEITPTRGACARIQHRAEPEKDWAKTGRYLNIGTTDSNGLRRGIPHDLPISSDCTFTDEQVLTAFVAAVCGITGYKVK